MNFCNTNQITINHPRKTDIELNKTNKVNEPEIKADKLTNNHTSSNSKAIPGFSLKPLNLGFVKKNNEKGNTNINVNAQTSYEFNSTNNNKVQETVNASESPQNAVIQSGESVKHNKDYSSGYSDSEDLEQECIIYNFQSYYVFFLYFTFFIITSIHIQISNKT